MSPDLIAVCTGGTPQRSALWAEPLSIAMDTFAINRPLRQVAFLANVGHESGSLRFAREIWGPTAAQLRYEGRKDLGNLRPGDGRKYLGRGPLQVTGHANYIVLRDQLREYVPNVPDFEQSPELLEIPRWGALAAALFWQKHGLNERADARDFDGCCDVVNRGHKTEAEGDSLGYTERLAFYNAGLAALGVS